MYGKTGEWEGIFNWANLGIRYLFSISFPILDLQGVVELVQRSEEFVSDCLNWCWLVRSRSCRIGPKNYIVFVLYYILIVCIWELHTPLIHYTNCPNRNTHDSTALSTHKSGIYPSHLTYKIFYTITCTALQRYWLRLMLNNIEY